MKKILAIALLISTTVFGQPYTDTNGIVFIPYATTNYSKPIWWSDGTNYDWVIAWQGWQAANTNFTAISRWITDHKTLLTNNNAARAGLYGGLDMKDMIQFYSADDYVTGSPNFQWTQEKLMGFEGGEIGFTLYPNGDFSSIGTISCNGSGITNLTPSSFATTNAPAAGNALRWNGTNLYWAP